MPIPYYEISLALWFVTFLCFFVDRFYYRKAASSHCSSLLKSELELTKAKAQKLEENNAELTKFINSMGYSLHHFGNDFSRPDHGAETLQLRLSEKNMIKLGQMISKCGSYMRALPNVSSEMQSDLGKLSLKEVRELFDYATDFAYINESETYLQSKVSPATSEIIKANKWIKEA